MTRKIAALAMVLALTGCATKRYFGRGLVVDLDSTAKVVTIAHDRIPGFMEPMTMPFIVPDSRLLEGVERGQRVHFRLAVGKKKSHLEHLAIVSAPPVDPAKWQSPVVSRVIRTGEEVPDFELTDHNGERVSISQLRGKILAVTFIYTRCPLPDYCPRMTANFVSLRNRFRSRLGKDLALVNVTLDPQYDTPKILRAYAKAFRAEATGWYFLTGSREEIVRVCGFFGVEFWPDEGAITHNLQTALIDRRGRMVANVEGRDYSATQLGDLVEFLLHRK